MSGYKYNNGTKDLVDSGFLYTAEEAAIYNNHAASLNCPKLVESDYAPLFKPALQGSSNASLESIDDYNENSNYLNKYLPLLDLYSYKSFYLVNKTINVYQDATGKSYVTDGSATYSLKSPFIYLGIQAQGGAGGYAFADTNYRPSPAIRYGYSGGGGGGGAFLLLAVRNRSIELEVNNTGTENPYCYVYYTDNNRFLVQGGRPGGDSSSIKAGDGGAGGICEFQWRDKNTNNWYTDGYLPTGPIGSSMSIITSGRGIAAMAAINGSAGGVGKWYTSAGDNYAGIPAGYYGGKGEVISAADLKYYHPWSSNQCNLRSDLDIAYAPNSSGHVYGGAGGNCFLRAINSTSSYGTGSPGCNLIGRNTNEFSADNSKAIQSGLVLIFGHFLD